MKDHLAGALYKIRYVQKQGPDVKLKQNLTLLIQGSWNKAFTEFMLKTQCSMEILMQADGYLKIYSFTYTDLSYIKKNPRYSK